MFLFVLFGFCERWYLLLCEIIVFLSGDDCPVFVGDYFVFGFFGGSVFSFSFAPLILMINSSCSYRLFGLMGSAIDFP
jgi:hypothetical protein